MRDVDTHGGFHLKNGKHVCNKCGFASNSEASFKEHSLNYHNCNNFQCCYCSDKFYYKYDMIKHEFIHVLEINKVHKTTCDNCQSDHSSWKVYLKCRRENAHKISLTCRKCSVSFKDYKEKRDHLKTCSKPMTNHRTSFLCELCGKMVSSLQSFNNHYRTHTGEKPYACKVCGRSFTTNVGLHYHKRIHTGAKPYECYECGKCFAQRSSYVMHSKTHIGEKPYKCAVCAKYYVTKTVLKIHKKRHTEV